MSSILPFVVPVTASISVLIALASFLRTQKVRRDDISREAEIRKEAADRERLKEARNSWRDYLALAFDNPRFSSGFAHSKGDPESREQYEWYVSSMLFSAEGILEAAASDPDWRETVKSQFDHHREYLCSEEFKKYLGGYSPPLRTLINEWALSACNSKSGGS